MMSDSKAEALAKAGYPFFALYIDSGRLVRPDGTVEYEGWTADELKQKLEYKRKPNGEGPFVVWTLLLGPETGVRQVKRWGTDGWVETEYTEPCASYSFYGQTCSEVLDRAMAALGIKKAGKEEAAAPQPQV